MSETLWDGIWRGIEIHPCLTGSFTPWTRKLMRLRRIITGTIYADRPGSAAPFGLAHSERRSTAFTLVGTAHTGFRSGATNQVTEIRNAYPQLLERVNPELLRLLLPHAGRFLGALIAICGGLLCISRCGLMRI